MPKMKTHRGAAKRFKKTGTGKLKRAHAFTSHILTKKSKLFKTANESVIRALRNAYVGRRLKKRDYRRLWIARINAATRMNGLSYSRFMNGMKLAGVDINRKMLSEIAINDPKAFADLVELAKKHLNA